jgi:hypothetical protein
MYTHSPSKPKKFKQRLLAGKLMATVFWARKGVLMVEFMQQGTIIMSEVYCETLKKLCRTIQNKRREMLTSDIVLLYDNACPTNILLFSAFNTSLINLYEPVSVDEFLLKP